MTLTAIELFCGMGGATEGLRRAGLHVTLAMDAWDAAVKAHKRWHPDTPVVQARCEAAPINGAHPWLVWASPSCKPWSVANRTPKRGKAHPEYYSTARLVRQAVEMHARWLVVENVAGLLWSREGKAELAEMRAEAQRQGLRWTVSVVNSNTVGVAQIRRRLFIVVGPDYVLVPHGNDYIPPENAETPPMACEGSKGSWERETRWPKAGKGICANEHGLSRSPATLGRWRAAQRGVVHSRLPSRDGVRGMKGSRFLRRDEDAAARTLADCAALQQVPLAPLDGLSKRDAHELIGNAVPPPLAAHVILTIKGWRT